MGPQPRGLTWTWHHVTTLCMREKGERMSRQSRLLSAGKHLFAWGMQHPQIILVAIILVTVFFATQIPRLSFQTSVYEMVIEDLPETEAHRLFKEIFGSDEIIRLVVKTGGVFDPDVFGKIESLAEAAADIHGVRKVISLPGIKKAIDVTGEWDLDKFAAVIAPVDLFRKNLVSEDRKKTVLTLILADDANPDTVIDAVEKLIAHDGAPLSLYQIGMPLISRALVQFTKKDFIRLPPLIIVLIAGILLLLFRRLNGVLLPLVCVLTALVWTLGLMAIIGIKLSMLTMIVPVFLIAVGTAYCLHILSEYMTRCEGDESKKEIILKTYAAIAFPTALAVITTVIGLGSLLINHIPMIREFSLAACFGILCLLILTMTLMPALMRLLPKPTPPENLTGTGRCVGAIIEFIIRLNVNHHRKALVFMAAVAIICAIGICFIRVETNPVNYFKSDLAVIRHFHDIHEDLSGSFPINLVMSGTDEDYFEDPEHIADIARCQQLITPLAGVDKTVSFADYLKLVNYATNRFEPAYYRLPEADWELRGLINNFKSLLGHDMFSRFMSPDLSKTNIMMLTHHASSADFMKTRDAILSRVHPAFSKDLGWDVTGFGIVISASSHLLTSGQIKSLSIAIVMVFGIMFLLFLSCKVGCIAVATNLFPIVVLFGLMGWFGVELSMVTILIASIAIGLAVDDTIHYLVRYNREFRKDLSDERALRATLRHVGRPVLFTTLTISIGFSILLFSSFKPTAVFGIMMMLTMMAALLGDMVVLPSLMRNVELVTLWDLVRLKLGEEPRLGIPLFHGMSRSQVHYICMAGALRELKAGEVLFRKGEISDSMYAVISGEIEVIDHAVESDIDENSGYMKHLKTLVPGDVVGEMGLLRAAPRSATVVAYTPGELLQINLKMIQRLQWLYPPTAHKFFFNLMQILCNRLETVSHCLFESSMVDDLTGLWNKKGILAQLDKEVSRSRRYNTPLSLCLLKFKNGVGANVACFDFDDPHALKVSQTLQYNLRGSDTLGRLDTKTFAMILPETPPARANEILERLQGFIASSDFAATPEDCITLQFGVAGLPGDPNPESGEALFRHAFTALNTSKHSPRPRGAGPLS